MISLTLAQDPEIFNIKFQIILCWRKDFIILDYNQTIRDIRKFRKTATIATKQGQQSEICLFCQLEMVPSK